MAARRTERLLNLVICLLHTRSYLTADRIREIVAGYEEAASDEAFKRMFERDKEDLRDLGIPLETGSTPYDDEVGYRVPRGEYALPDITLEPDEAAAVGLAARMWSSASLGASATRALRKLEATGVDVTPLPEGLQPRLDGGGSGFPVLAEAVRAGRQVSFDYQGATDATRARRTVDPWGVVWWHGRWYLAGHDLDRDAPRVFRLSRLRSEPQAIGAEGAVRVPEGLDLIALVSSYDRSATSALARLRIRRDRAVGLRRQAVDVTQDGPEWDLVTISCPDAERLVDQVLEYGADVVVLTPAEARDLIVRRLQAVAGSFEMSGATDHLPRLLALVPWLLAHPGTSIDDAAREFGVTPNQLRADVSLVWMCGLPGYTPGDLIDVEWVGDRVTLSNADTIARPLRLTSEEAVALVAALRALSGVPGIVDTAAVDRALGKLEAAAGAAVAGERVVAAPAVDADPEVVIAVTDAVARSRRVHLSYWVPARDETTERDVDPIRLFTAGGAAYLSGWCRSVEGVRTFRLDRVLAATVLGIPAEVPPEAGQRQPEPELFTPSPDDRLVSITLSPPARWVADYYPCESVRERADGGLDITLRGRDDAWICRLGLSLAGVATVTDPAEVTGRIRQMAQSALAGYP